MNLTYFNCYLSANPEPPRILSVKTSPTTAEVTWEFSYDGGIKLLSLTLQYKISSSEKWKSIQITPAEATTYTITDLQSDTNYNYRILASNSIGSSAYSSIYMAKTMKKGIYSQFSIVLLFNVFWFNLLALIHDVSRVWITQE